MTIHHKGVGIMKVFMIAFVAVFLFSGLALAQIDPDPDGIGIYADLAATQNSMFFTGYPMLEVYLIGTNLTATTTIYGIDLGLRISSPDAILAGASFPADGTNLKDLPHIFVAFPPGNLMPGNIVHLATLSVFTMTSEPVELFIEDTEYGQPSYYVAPDSDMISLNQSSGSAKLPVFRFNGLGPVESESTSWGELKSLFR